MQPYCGHEANADDGEKHPGLEKRNVLTYAWSPSKLVGLRIGYVRLGCQVPACRKGCRRHEHDPDDRHVRRPERGFAHAVTVPVEAGLLGIETLPREHDHRDGSRHAANGKVRFAYLMALIPL